MRGTGMRTIVVETTKVVAEVLMVEDMVAQEVLKEELETPCQARDGGYE